MQLKSLLIIVTMWIVVAFAMGNLCFGQTYWKRTYGDSLGSFYMIIPTTDGNFILGGNIRSFGAGNSDGWLLKIKPNGDTIWTRTYSGSGDDYFRKIFPITDGNFLIGGNTNSFGAGNYDFWLLKINSNGDTLYSKTYGGAEDDYFSMIKPTCDGNFLIVGFTNSYSAGSWDGWLLKIKPNGDTLWTKTYSGVSGDGFSSIQPSNDGNFLIAGHTYSYRGGGDRDGWIICVIADQYAYKDSLFTYKIPTYGVDTLNFGYAPLITPSGMTVSVGGTISWTPKTDSVYMDHAEFLVANDAGTKDTLTFNIFINSDYHAPASIKPSRIKKTDSKPFKIFTTSLSGKIKFSLPSSAGSICIYDLNGRLVDKITPINSGSGAYAIWPSASSSYAKIPAGKYFAKVSLEKNTTVKPFLFCR